MDPKDPTQSGPSEGFPLDLDPQTGSENVPGPEAQSILEEVRDFSENVAASSESALVSAGLPFDLRIEGKLSPAEQEKVSSLLTRGNLGISEVDLEPQFASGRILIPRISETIGVLVAQALRSARVRISLMPSPEDPSENPSADPSAESDAWSRIDFGISEADGHAEALAPHPADELPLSTDSSLPQFPEFRVLETVMASASLRSTAVEAQSSRQYEVLLENLKREIKFKAYHKGACGLVGLKIQLDHLSFPTGYRLTLTASAITVGL